MEYNQELLNKLISLALEYEKKGDIASNGNLVQYIVDLVKCIVEEQELEDYVYSIKPYLKYKHKLTKDNVCPAEYLSSRKELVIYLEPLVYIFTNLDGTFIGKKDNISFICLIVAFIYHELNHANQRKIINGTDSSLERDLVFNSYCKDSMFKEEPCTSIFSTKFWQQLKYLIDLRKKLSKVYVEYHDYAPHERLANISAWKLFVDMVRSLEIEDVTQAGLEHLIKCYEFGYGVEQCPTITYFQEKNKAISSIDFDILKCVDIEKLMQDSSTLDSQERFKMGLELNQKEYEEEIARLRYIYK